MGNNNWRATAMRTLLMMIALVLSVSAAHAQRGISARDLLKACQSDKDGEHATCVGFMVGFMSAAQEAEIMFERPFISCSTAATILLSGETLADAAIEYLGRHPETLNERAGQVTTAVIRSILCPTG
jgi:hypothetical protein